MLIRLKRTRVCEYGVFGTLEAAPGLKLITLEHNFNGAPKVPTGTYTCKRGIHELEHGKPFETFEVTSVPGHTGILFHVGNFNIDSNGCILLGVSDNGSSIGQSKIAFNRFIEALVGINEFTLEVLL